MEFFKEEKFREENFEEERKEIKTPDKMLEKHFFVPKEAFDYKKLGELARLEGNFSAPENKKNWPFEKERRRCELKKNLELALLNLKSGEIIDYWKKNEQEYLDNFGRSRKQEANNSYNLLKSGVLNELIATKILQKITGFPVGTTIPEIDINNKIDLLCSSEKTILAIQVKSKSRKDMGKERENVFEEVGLISSEPKKNDFIKGCFDLEKELNLKDHGIELKKIWFNVPP